MPQPKQKTAKGKTRRRRANSFMKLRGPAMGKCPKCFELKMAHFACPHCGFYNGRQVIQVKEKKTEG